MTPQERAAALYATLSCVLYNEGHHDADQDIAVLAEALQTTRRAALLEAREVVLAEVLEDFPDNEADEAYNLAIGHAAHALDRLAQEG